VDYVTGLAPTNTVGVPIYVQGKYGQGINFPNSTNTGTTKASNYSIYTTSVSATAGFTVCFWVNFNYGSVFAQTIFAFGNSVGSRILNIFLNGSNQLVTYDGVNLNFPSFSSFSTGTWYHIAFVVGGGNRTAYLNGQSTTAVTNFTGTTSTFMIGGDYVNNFSAWCSYDDLRIYNTALTAAQVKAIYTQGGMPGRASLGNAIGSSKISLYNS
jgi:hypothetical protein